MIRFARDSQLTANQTGKVDPQYMAEVEAHTERRVREYAAAERRLEAARKRHEKAEAVREAARNARDRKAAERAVQKAWALVEERLRELREIDRLMREVPASAAHRGTKQARHRA